MLVLMHISPAHKRAPALYMQPGGGTSCSSAPPQPSSCSCLSRTDAPTSCWHCLVVLVQCCQWHQARCNGCISNSGWLWPCALPTSMPAFVRRVSYIHSLTTSKATSGSFFLPVCQAACCCARSEAKGGNCTTSRHVPSSCNHSASSACKDIGQRMMEAGRWNPNPAKVRLSDHLSPRCTRNTAMVGAPNSGYECRKIHLCIPHKVI